MEKNGHLYSQQYDHVPTSESNIFPYLLRIEHCSFSPLSRKLEQYRHSSNLAADSKVTIIIKLVYMTPMCIFNLLLYIHVLKQYTLLLCLIHLNR